MKSFYEILVGHLNFLGEETIEMRQAMAKSQKKPTPKKPK
jgi:hypothetical protein